MDDRTASIPPRYTANDALDPTLTRREVLRNKHMRSTIWIEKAQGVTDDSVGRNTFGDSAYDPPIDYKALILFRQESVTTPTGDDVISVTQVVLQTPPPAVTVNDRITLPDGSQPLILAVRGDADPAIAPRVILT